MTLLSLPPISQQIWDTKYRLKQADGTPVDQTVDDTWRRVATAIAAPESNATRAMWAERFYGMLSDFAFLPAGRIIAGAGSGRDVTLFNCFVMGRIGDDLTSIFVNVKEAALTMQRGGGIGHDFSTLRPSGALVRSVGAGASGPVSFMDVWDAMCRTIMSAGQRRGAMMATLRCDHPDIEIFIDAKADARRLRNFNLSVLVTDAFLDAVRADAPWNLVFEGTVYRTVSARALWDRIMHATYAYAEPGVIFIDRINTNNNLAYCEEIRATNPCVPGDTWVHTSEGPRQVRDLLGHQFLARVGGRDHLSGPAGFFKTGTKPLVQLETSEGYTLRLTADHLVRKVTCPTRYRTETDWCAAGDLAPGDLVVLNDHRGNAAWAGDLTAEEGYLLGLLVGDGTLKTDKAVLSVWRPAMAVHGSDCAGVDGIMAEALRAARTLPHRADFVGWQAVTGRNEHRLALGALKQLAARVGMQPGSKAITPAIESASSEFYRGFLRGFFDADGSVQGSQAKGVSVRLAQSNLSRLEAVQRMLLRLGIASTLYRERRTASVRALPDGRGGEKNYPTQAHHELIISGENLLRFYELVGFADYDKAARISAAISSYRRALNRERFVAQVVSITEQGAEDVYDVQIPGINAFDANGIVAHNCGEQPLPPYGACLLGSINLARLVEKPFTPEAGLNETRLAELVPIAVRFLDNAIDVSAYPLEDQRREAKAKRRIGLGVTGLANALIMCGIAYGSPEAVRRAEQWMAVIEREAYRASAALAAEKGTFPLFEATPFLASPNVTRLPVDVREAIARHGIRNGCLTSIAPTGTISLLAANVSSGVEPVFDFRYTRRVRGAGDDVREEQVEDYAHALFRSMFGSEHRLPPAFITTAGLSPRAHLEMQAALQCHVDSSISKTINCPEDLSFEAFKDVYLEAYALGLKGCTTFRPNAVTGSVLASASPAPSAAAAEAETARPLSSAVSIPDRHADVVYMSKPLERDAVLEGFTYKLRWGGSDHAIYVTINDIERDGRRRPFEVFINTKNLEHYAWTVALTRMISAVFRRGGDVTFVVDELKAIFDPQGGHWMNGRYVPSLLAAIGGVIETHMLRIGFLQRPREDELRIPAAAHGDTPDAADLGAGIDRPEARKPVPRRCPRCQQASFLFRSGCWICRDCGYSKCG
jgi:ribonucleoside-diphosphate reductase alpha chain